MTSSSCTTTAPTGTSPINAAASASSSARCMNFSSALGMRLTDEPRDRGHNVVVEHAVVALTERQPREIRELAVRNDDGSAQMNIAYRFVELALRPRNVD